jgi:2-polyprenyl-6-methoxyphenol hydroxylase-like FAD-dependent oxidoreductase
MCLAQQGVQVVQLFEPECAERPPEVLDPRARSLLAAMGAREASEAGFACAGVLSRWRNPEPDRSDFRLMQGLEGRCVGRLALHGQLRAAALQAGVTQAHARVTAADDHGVVWKDPEGASGATAAEWTLLACGRSTAPRLLDGFSRIRRDRLVALAFPAIRLKFSDLLVLEALEEGWWYAPPGGAERSWVVTVAGAEQMRNAGDRHDFLESALSSLSAIARFGQPRNASRCIGMNATAGGVFDPVRGRLVVLGDAAIALDPLSGSGIRYAVEGAVVAAHELVTSGVIGPTYRSWFNSLQTSIEQARWASYAAAIARFPNSAFWRRRIATFQPHPGLVERTALHQDQRMGVPQAGTPGEAESAGISRSGRIATGAAPPSSPIHVETSPT